MKKRRDTRKRKRGNDTEIKKRKRMKINNQVKEEKNKLAVSNLP